MGMKVFAKGTAAIACGLWLTFSILTPAYGEDDVEVVKLAAGELRIVNTGNDDDKSPRVEFAGKQIDLGYGRVSLKAKFRLSNRDIVVVEVTGDVRNMPSSLSVLSIGPGNEFSEIVPTENVSEKNKDGFDPRLEGADFTFVAKQKGDMISFDLGYEGGFKKDAVLSGSDLIISHVKPKRLEIPAEACNALHEQVLDECEKGYACVSDDFSNAAKGWLRVVDENPIWEKSEGKFQRLCKQACDTHKRPSFTAFSRDICGK